MIKAKVGDRIDGWLQAALPFLFRYRVNPNLLTVLGALVSLAAAVCLADHLAAELGLGLVPTLAPDAEEEEPPACAGLEMLLPLNEGPEVMRRGPTSSWSRSASRSGRWLGWPSMPRAVVTPFATQRNSTSSR